jgi:holo-[acyl-carrier protein] synthase
MTRIGVDLVEVERIKAIYEQRGERFLDRLFTRVEIAYAFSARGDRQFERLAARFAIKEALIKAVGRPLPYSSIEVRNQKDGRPIVRCSHVRGKIEASLSHTRRLAIACILFEGP